MHILEDKKLDIKTRYSYLPYNKAIQVGGQILLNCFVLVANTKYVEVKLFILKN